MPPTSLEEIHVDDTPEIILRFLHSTTKAVQDLSGFTSLTVVAIKPDGTSATWTASFVTDGMDGKIKYQTVDGDIAMAGYWTFYGLVSDGVLTRRSSSVTREVFA